MRLGGGMRAALAVAMVVCVGARWVPAPVPNTTMTAGDLPHMNEGVASSNDSFFFNSQTHMLRTTLDMARVLNSSSDNFLPQSLQALGYRHCGDSVYVPSMASLLLSCSCYPHKTHPPFIAVMDAATFVFDAARVTYLPKQGDAPWVAVDEAAGEVYTVLNLTTLQPSRTIKLSAPLMTLQGGEVYNGTLYVGGNVDDTIYTIDTKSGAVGVALEQKGGHEMEGMTFRDLRSAGKGVMHFFENGRDPKVLFHYDFQ